MAKKKIALIGGGQIGGIQALLLAQKQLGDVVMLDIPEKEGMTKGKMLDIAEGSGAGKYASGLKGTANYDDIAGADVVVVTAGLPRKPGMTRDDLLDINVKIISGVARQVKEKAPNAFCVIITNPLDSMVYAFRKITGFPKNQVCGMAGVLDTSRFKYFVADALNVCPDDVSALVLGGHGPTMVPLARLATVAGIPVTELLSAEVIAAISKRTAEAGTEIVNLLGNGSAFVSPAVSSIEMVESYLLDKKRVLPIAAYLEGEYGINGYYLGVPAVIGGGGVEKVLEVKLTDEEKAKLNKSLDAVLAAVKDVDVRI